jgi:hypothetical protein
MRAASSAVLECNSNSSAHFGPLMMLGRVLEPKGAWRGLRGDLATIYERGEPTEYLVVPGRKQ